MNCNDEPVVNNDVFTELLKEMQRAHEIQMVQLQRPANYEAVRVISIDIQKAALSIISGYHSEMTESIVRLKKHEL